MSIATLMGATQAQAFDFKISGQANRAIIAADNGEDSDIGFVDNHSSNTRFGFDGSQQIDADNLIGFEYVVGLGDNQSSNFGINQSPSGVGLQNRQANVYIKGNFGKFTLGKQDGAANSTSKVDYSGLTDLGGGSVVGDYMGDVSFLADKAGADGEYAHTTIDSVYSNFDALSRVNAIRYDTPSLGGVTLFGGVGYIFGKNHVQAFSRTSRPTSVFRSCRPTRRQNGVSRVGCNISAGSNSGANRHEAPR